MVKRIALTMVEGLVAALGGKAGTSVTDALDTRLDALEAVGAPVFTKEFVSAEQELSSAGTGTLAHGLGVAPKLVQAAIVCKTAESGYAVGDVVIIGSINQNTDRGVSIVPSATSIFYRYINNTPFALPNKTSGAISGVTAANWRMVIKAWA